MIINLRGTSGSGKSTIVRRIMELYPIRLPFRLSDLLPNRKNPAGYVLSGRFNGRPNLVVVGHYESACGGCDTISGYDVTFRIIREAHEQGNDVLFEGLLLSGDVKRIVELDGQVDDLRIVAIDLPLDECLASVNARRREKDPAATDVDPKTTTAKFKGVQSAMRKFQERGMKAQWADRDGAFQLLAEWLGLDL